MKIEIDTVKKEIVVHNATSEELLVILKDYLGYTIKSNEIVLNTFTVPSYEELVFVPPMGPQDPIQPYWTTTTTNTHPDDLLNKLIFE